MMSCSNKLFLYSHKFYLGYIRWYFANITSQHKRCKCSTYIIRRTPNTLFLSITLPSSLTNLLPYLQRILKRRTPAQFHSPQIFNLLSCPILSTSLSSFCILLYFLVPFILLILLLPHSLSLNTKVWALHSACRTFTIETDVQNHHLVFTLSDSSLSLRVSEG
jgi:hypothetical protein